MSNNSSGVMGIYEGIPFEVLDLPKENQILVVKIDFDKYDIETARNIYDSIRSTISEDITMLAIPSDIKLECWSVEDLNGHIKYCKSIRGKIK